MVDGDCGFFFLGFDGHDGFNGGSGFGFWGLGFGGHGVSVGFVVFVNDLLVLV